MLFVFDSIPDQYKFQECVSECPFLIVCCIDKYKT